MAASTSQTSTPTEAQILEGAESEAVQVPAAEETVDAGTAEEVATPPRWQDLSVPDHHRQELRLPPGGCRRAGVHHHPGGGRGRRLGAGDGQERLQRHDLQADRDEGRAVDDASSVLAPTPASVTTETDGKTLDPGSALLLPVTFDTDVAGATFEVTLDWVATVAFAPNA